MTNKIDIMNAYAASYTSAAGDHIIYFGMEKNTDNGVNDVGFWFLQGNANCAGKPGGGTAWTGNHSLGDVLVVSEFSNGGGVSNVTAYKWVGGKTARPAGAGRRLQDHDGGRQSVCHHERLQHRSQQPRLASVERKRYDEVGHGERI